MHMFSAEKRFYGGHGIVGACVPIGAGLGFAHKYNGTSNVSLTYYGDGAANHRQLYAAFTMAALSKLPVVFITENTQYGMGTSVQRASASPDFYRRGEPFGIPGRKVDGMDVLAVREAGEAAVAHCRAGKGPYILQMETYRYRGHSMSDPAKYRTRDEVERVRTERDPIQTMHNHLVDAGFAKDEELKKIDQAVKKAVTEAADFAIADPEPDPSELYTDVYA
jgi:pyruvate dehydrogenase E1 component alpha subunit